MSELINLDEKRTLMEKIEKVLDSDNFLVVYTDENGHIGIVRGEGSLMDMTLYRSIVDYATQVEIEHMFIQQLVGDEE